MRRSSWISTLLCCLTLACSSKNDNNTEISVVVWSDLAVPTEMDNIRINIKGATDTSSIPFQLSANSLPLQVSLVPPNNNNNLLFDVKATGFLGTNPIVSQEASLSFLPGQRRVLTLFLGRACGGVICDPGSTCFAGTCKPAAVSPSSLPVYDPNHLPSPPDAGVKAPVDSGSVDTGTGAETAGVDATADRAQIADAAVDVAVFSPDGGVDIGGGGGNSGYGGTVGTGGASASGGAGGAKATGGTGPGGMDGGMGGSGGMVTAGSGGAVGLDAASDLPIPQSDVPLSAPETADSALPDTADVSSCVANAGVACGSCGGTITCTGACSAYTPWNLGTACGSCGGNITCGGSCSVPTPSNYGTTCGSCGGKIKCDGTCDVPTPANYGAGCGSCGGTIKCDGTCSAATPSNFGSACGSCGGTVTCSGCSIPTPSNYGTACGSCGGTITCAGTCSGTPTNYGASCGSCGGTITCAGTCSVATPSNLGASCGSCGGKVTCTGCSVATPSNYGASCLFDCGVNFGGIIGGTIGCEGECDDNGGCCVQLCP